MTEKRKVCMIDGNALMHRAFHAIPGNFTAPDGTPTNAVFGFFNMFCKYVGDLKPDVTICTFDHGKATHRLELFEKYKANRPHMDENLRIQFPVVERILKAMDVPIFVEEGWEGDDVMGSISAKCCDGHCICYLVTGDKDMNQLVKDGVYTVTSDVKNKNLIIRDSVGVKDRFGVEPSQIIDYLAIVGDKSDNIPGVEGIGDKGARDLLNKYGSLEGIYENLSDFKGKKLEHLINGKDDAYLSRTLATINQHLDIDVDILTIESFNYDEQALREVLAEYGLNSTAANFKKTINSLTSIDAAAADVASIAVIFPAKKPLEDCLEAIKQAIDIKENIAFSLVAPTKTYVRKTGDSRSLVGIATKDVMTFASLEQASDVVAKALGITEVCAYDAKEIIKLAFPHDNTISAKISEKDLLNASIFDIHVCANLLNSSVTYKTQEDFFSELGKTYAVEDDIEQRACEFAYLTLVAHDKQVESLNKIEANKKIFDEIEKPLTCVLSIIERNGCRLDDDVLASLKQYCTEEINALKTKIFELAGHEFSVDSPAQLSTVLFEELGIKPLKKTKTGFSTDANVLTQLAEEHEICLHIMKYRELAKLESTYIDSLPKIRLNDNLVHTNFNQAATATGRLSSSDPNLQNIPVRTDLGRKIREAFLPLQDDHFFLSADYSQIELRLLAHLSGDEHLIAAFLSGRDFHTQTAARIFGVDEEEVTAHMRSSAKAVNFGIIYGQQAFTLSKQLGISFGEAKDIIDRYYYSYPQVRSFLDNTVKQATVNGYAETLTGRRRVIPELASSNKQTQQFGQRTAMNHPMQGSAADIIKIAMIELQRHLTEHEMESRVLIQVHDELDLSVAPAELEEVKSLVKSIMENVVELKVPLIADVTCGKNWSEAH